MIVTLPEYLHALNRNVMTALRVSLEADGNEEASAFMDCAIAWAIAPLVTTVETEKELEERTQELCQAIKEAAALAYAGLHSAGEQKH